MKSTYTGIFLMQSAASNRDRMEFLIAAIAAAVAEGVDLREVIERLRKYRDPDPRVTLALRTALKGV